MKPPLQKVRIDRWLWAVRIFKTRTIAADMLNRGRVRINQMPAKPSTMVQRGQTVEVKKEGFTFTFKVLELLEQRVGAPTARTCYDDLTPPEELNKYKAWFGDLARSEYRDRGAGRPTKKERRDIDDFKTTDTNVPAADADWSTQSDNYFDSFEDSYDADGDAAGDGDGGDGGD